MSIWSSIVGLFSSAQPLNLDAFNRQFVEGNNALKLGNTEGLKSGIGSFVEALPVAGEFCEDLAQAIQALRGALSHHDRADAKGPWNRDMSGYGVLSWQNDIYDRNDALRRAWPHIEAINTQLKARSLGCNY